MTHEPNVCCRTLSQRVGVESLPELEQALAQVE